jgi:hypothetical protein
MERKKERNIKTTTKRFKRMDKKKDQIYAKMGTECQRVHEVKSSYFLEEGYFFAP